MRDTTALHPKLQIKIGLEILCEKKGLKIGVGECLRTADEQNALYAQGMHKAGEQGHKRPWQNI